jgi:hypothetical protein
VRNIPPFAPQILIEKYFANFAKIRFTELDVTLWCYGEHSKIIRAAQIRFIFNDKLSISYVQRYAIGYDLEYSFLSTLSCVVVAGGVELLTRIDSRASQEKEAVPLTMHYILDRISKMYNRYTLEFF